jgi:hypothetical protein
VEPTPAEPVTAPDPIAAAEKAAREIDPQARRVDASFFEQSAFRSLAEPVQACLRVILSMVPDRAPSVASLIGSPAFLALSPEEQQAAVTPPRPERLERTRRILEQPLWSALEGDKLRFFSAREGTQDAVLAQFEAFPQLETGRALMRLLAAPWFGKLRRDDQVRAVKVIAFCSSQVSGASFEEQGVRQRSLITNTLDALLPPAGSSGAKGGASSRCELSLRFEDLPFDDHDAVAGESRRPGTVILNRNAFSVDARPLGGGPDGLKEEHFALSTLVHEVNHLRNPEPPRGTALAFQDEYRAWFAGFVALMARFPTKVEGLARIKDLLTRSSYVELQDALDHRPEEARKILAFMQSFGPVKDRQEILGLTISDLVSCAPLPDPQLELNNARVSG